MKIDTELVVVSSLKPHEEHDPENVRVVLHSMLRSGLWSHPVLVERDNYVILDGHHRIAAAQQIGLILVPAIIADYEDVVLQARSEDLDLTKNDVLNAALSGKLFPVKTTRHIWQREQSAAAIDIRSLMKSGTTSRIRRIWSAGPPPRRPGNTSRYLKKPTIAHTADARSSPASLGSAQ